MGQSRPLFVYFFSFHVTISIQIEKRVDGVLGIQTQGRRMVGADETTELLRPPLMISLIKIFLNGPNPAYFCLISFFSHGKYSTNTLI